jgi:hypothetical protein
MAMAEIDVGMFRSIVSGLIRWLIWAKLDNMDVVVKREKVLVYR